jgi:hypothetical protein
MVWAGIKRRCESPDDKLYEHYGARGIRLWPKWRDDFAEFARYMDDDPGPGWEVGRINNDRGYEPGNVRWETHRQNMRNKRSTRWVEVRGELLALSEACEKYGVPYKRVWHRMMRQGQSVDEALFG